MDNITGLGLENFKVFKDKTSFEFAPITILTGTNNSGKSTVINAMRLLKEVFEPFQEEKELYKNIDQILMVDFDVHSLIERYGHLAQFISHSSNGDEFSFSFFKKMIAINDVAEIEVKVRIKENQLRNGEVTELKMKSVTKGKVIFHIYEDPGETYKTENNRENSTSRMQGRDNNNVWLNILNNQPKYISPWLQVHSVIRIDLIYFYDALVDRIIKNNEYRIDRRLVLEKKMQIEKFNRKYGTNFDESLISKDRDPNTQPDFVLDRYSLNEKTQRITADMEDYGIYDFTPLLKEDNKSIAFKNLLQNYYKKDVKEAVKSFSFDVLGFLSEVEWINILNYSFDLGSSKCTLDPLYCGSMVGLSPITEKGEIIFGLSLERFIKLFCLGEGVKEFSFESKLIIRENLLQSAIVKGRNFYDQMLKPFIYLVVEIIESDKGEIFIKTGTQSNLVELNIGKRTLVEDVMYNMVYDNINLSTSCLNELKTIDFLSVNRIVPKRIYSLGDQDEFSRIIKSIAKLEQKQSVQINSFINKWLNMFGIGEKFEIIYEKDSGYFKPYVEKGGKKFLLADLGFGTMQVLPTILKLLPTYNSDPEAGYLESMYLSKKVIMEEPEANLHPALQSKLADMFVEAIQKFNIQLIIETHSEYLIRKLQYLTAKKEIAPELTQIYYFYHPDKVPPGEKQVLKININEDGSLTNDFGTGFFDEADKIAMTIWSMNQSQKN